MSNQLGIKKDLLMFLRLQLHSELSTASLHRSNHMTAPSQTNSAWSFYNKLHCHLLWTHIRFFALNICNITFFIFWKLKMPFSVFNIHSWLNLTLRTSSYAPEWYNKLKPIEEIKAKRTLCKLRPVEFSLVCCKVFFFLREREICEIFTTFYEKDQVKLHVAFNSNSKNTKEKRCRQLLS